MGRCIAIKKLTKVLEVKEQIDVVRQNLTEVSMLHSSISFASNDDRELVDQFCNACHVDMVAGLKHFLSEAMAKTLKTLQSATACFKDFMFGSVHR